MAAQTIYLVASAGYPNYGDELVVAQWLRFLADRHPDAEVWLDSPWPGSSEVLLGHLHPNVRFVDTIWNLAWAAPTEEAWGLAHFIDDAIRNPGVVPRRAAGVELLHGVDVFHVLGGGYISALWPRNLAALGVGSTLAGEYGVRAALTGAGLVPASASRLLLDRLTADYAVVDTRDAESQALFSEGRASATGDDVLLDLGADLYDARPAPPAMLNLQSDLAEVGVGALVESALLTLEQWGMAGGEVGYVECIPRVDRVVFDLLEPSFPGMRFYPFTEIWRHGLPARQGQRWLSTRFHVHLVASSAGAWGGYIPIRPGYYDVKHESLTQRGSGWTLVEPGKSSPVEDPETDFRGLDPALGDAKREVAGRVYGPEPSRLHTGDQPRASSVL